MGLQSLPRVIRKHREVDLGEPVHITLMSDLHLESSLCDVDGVKSTLSERAKLPNHSAILIGDVMDLIGNQDVRRFRQSVQAPFLNGVDDWVNEAIEFTTDTLNIDGVVYDMVSPGNHEDEWLKRHGLDVTSVIAHNLNTSRGGYSGAIDYTISV